MKSTKLLALIAVGVAVSLLARTEKGKKITKSIADNAEDWADKLGDLAGQAGDKLSSLQSIVAKEVEGLTEDARKRIQSILEEGASLGKKAQKAVDARLN